MSGPAKAPDDAAVEVSEPYTAERAAYLLRRAHTVARRAQAMGRHPFGALLVAPDGETVLAEQGNLDTVNHAESTLARTAAANYPGAYLAQCTLVTTFEPCAMCAGTIYWAGIGRVLYGVAETDLLKLTGDNAQNPTLALPCRTVFASGQRQVEVVGPVAALRAELLAPHASFWVP
ncbi:MULTISPECIES: nucleoside deaminase [unclassified Acidovorax]|uniref:nucleoside deaminase n=1 Tax=unclassified Acidovorax TaxID=2684926 RepID=UPI00288328E6|nr:MULTISPECIES: nucleoside deaminase [unclassified Acidovorax]